MILYHGSNMSIQEIKLEKCRMQEDNNCDNRYDIVKGPVANDDLVLLFRQFSEGLISVETLVKAMQFRELTNQYSFHTEKAVINLLKIGERYV